MVRSLAALLLTVLVACARDSAPAAAALDAPPLSPLEWSAEHPGGRFAIRQTPSGAGCQLTALDRAQPIWTADTCAGTRDDLHFVSGEGERLLVLYPLPEGVGGRDWSEATVARLFVRGKEERRFVGAELVAAAAIADMSHDYSWLKGVGSGGGTAPRFAPGGDAIQLEVVGGAGLALGFDGSGAPGRAAAPAAPDSLAVVPAGATGGLGAASEADSLEADESTLWRWKDAEGGLNFSHWNQIPPPFRARARPVTAMIGTVSGNGAPPAAPPRGVSPEQWKALQAMRDDLDAKNARLREGNMARLRGEAPPAPNVGPRLNGMTDAERQKQEADQAAAAQAKAAEEKKLWEKQFELHRAVEKGQANGWGR